MRPHEKISVNRRSQGGAQHGGDPALLAASFRLRVAVVGRSVIAIVVYHYGERGEIFRATVNRPLSKITRSCSGGVAVCVGHEDLPTDGTAQLFEFGRVHLAEALPLQCVCPLHPLAERFCIDLQGGTICIDSTTRSKRFQMTEPLWSCTRLMGPEMTCARPLNVGKLRIWAWGPDSLSYRNDHRQHQDIPVVRHLPTKRAGKTIALKSGMIVPSRNEEWTCAGILIITTREPIPPYPQLVGFTTRSRVACRSLCWARSA